MQDRGTTCRSKCDVRMNNIESRMINSLEGVVLTIGGNLYKSDVCMGLRNNGRYLIINCSSSKDDGFEVWHTQDCRKKDAQCIQLNSACICQCLSGYSKVKGICSINVPKSNQTRGNVEEQERNLAVIGENATHSAEYVTIVSNAIKTSFDEHQQGNSKTAEDIIGKRCAAFFSGLLLGIIITLVLHRKCRLCVRKHIEPIDQKDNVISFSVSRIMECDVNIYPIDCNKQRNNDHLSSNDGLIDSPIYTSVLDISMEDCKQDDEYNHLNEQRNTDSHDDEYDHAGLLLCNEIYSDCKRNVLCVNSVYATAAEII
eukprot:XP_019924360.1 PREDICTED: uncharacterized protein LOC105331977 isoform X2 [Crassostrea gigas]